MIETKRIFRVCYERPRRLDATGYEWQKGKDEDRRGRGQANERCQSIKASGVEHKKPRVHEARQNCTQAPRL